MVTSEAIHAPGSMLAGMAGFDQSLYSLALLCRDGPRPWRWAIFKTGLKNPIQRSTRSLATEAEAQLDGEAALATLIEALQARRGAQKSRADPAAI